MKSDIQRHVPGVPSHDEDRTDRSELGRLADSRSRRLHLGPGTLNRQFRIRRATFEAATLKILVDGISEKTSECQSNDHYERNEAPDSPFLW